MFIQRQKSVQYIGYAKFECSQSNQNTILSCCDWQIAADRRLNISDTIIDDRNRSLYHKKSSSYCDRTMNVSFT